MLSEGDLALVVQKVDKAIHWINLPPAPQRSDLSGGYSSARYPTFEQPGPGATSSPGRFCLALEVRRQEKPRKSSDFSFLFLYILADLISFLEIQRLQLAGSSSTVFAVNLIQGKAPWERG